MYSNYVLLAANSRVGSAWRRHFLYWMGINVSIHVRIKPRMEFKLGPGALNSCSLLPGKSETGILHRTEARARTCTQTHTHTYTHAQNKGEALYNLPTLLVTVIMIVQSFPTSLCFVLFHLCHPLILSYSTPLSFHQISFGNPLLEPEVLCLLHSTTTSITLLLISTVLKNT